MTLKEKILNDFKEAFRAREEIRLSALRLLQAEIKNAEIAKRTRLVKTEKGIVEADGYLNDEEILQVISREIKKRKKAIELYEKGGRKDLADKEKAEIEILSVYLPKQLEDKNFPGLQ